MKGTFLTTCHIPVDEVNRNVEYCKSLNLPKPDFHGDRGPLAVVGGGNSILSNLEVLRNWTGDIWACGSSFQFLRKNGIKATFFYVDPAEDNVAIANCAEKAIVASCVHKTVLDSLEKSDVIVFDLICTPEFTNHHVTTMTCAPILSVQMGYRSVTFFGGDSSFEGGTSHAYQDCPLSNSLHVIVDGVVYWTDIQIDQLESPEGAFDF